MNRLLALLGSAFLALAAVASGVTPAGSGTKPVAPVQRPVDELFTGTLAGLPAVAVLRVEAGSVRSGPCLYRRRGRDIALVSGGKKGLLLEGTWRASEGAEAGKPISLVRIPIGPGEDAFLRQEATSLHPGAASGVDTWVFFPTEADLAVVPGSYSEAERGCRGQRVVVPWPEVRPALTVDRKVP